MLQSADAQVLGVKLVDGRYESSEKEVLRISASAA